ncbi:MAG: hypothetical protein WBA67_13625 [Jannaschia sp.]
MTTKLKTRAMAELVALMEQFQWDMAYTATRQDHIPAEWKAVWKERTGHKRKISLYVDEDVYKLFRSMGPGMGPRMNTVLGAFARARVAEMLEGQDTLEGYRAKWAGKRRPKLEESVERLWEGE